jgi:DNA helicase II / ATP-dependent DNA helicase PcrA
MPFYADLHIHSKHSRACSRDCDLEHLAWWAGRKGIGLVGTGDFTHPRWFEELRETLVPAEPGLFRLREELERAVAGRLPGSCRGPVRFMLSVEISTIYKRAERTRKVHHLVYVPDFDAAAAFNRRLGRVGNIASDGRPILGLDSRDLLEITLESGEGSYLVPAHVWTPWFAVLGSKSGFDAVEDCYADLAGHVFALETGLSSDPAMNWRVSALDRYRLVSNSDAHSPPMLGREASVFDTELDYFALRGALETGVGFRGTVEFFPEEGKYHLDGHRRCGVRLEPAETRARRGGCPVCGKPLTVGVLHRVEELADRPEGWRLEGAAGFRSLVQLPEVVGEILGVGARSRSVEREVAALVERFGPELGILERVPLEELRRVGSELLAEAVGRLRRGEVVREAGYDGEYGVIRMFDPSELRGGPAGETLFELAAVAPPPAAEAGVAPAEAAEAAAAAPGAPAAVEPVPARSRAAGSVLDGLDPDQRAAAVVEEGPLLIVAGPGTGKTRTVAHRIAYLVGERGVAPERWLAISFTRRAAGELRERLGALLGGVAGRVDVTTFHGLGLRVVREQAERLGLDGQVRVVDEGERLGLVRELLGGGSERDGRRALDRLARVRRARAAAAAGGVAEAAGSGSVVSPEEYERALRRRGLVDFDDLLALPVTLLAGDPELAARYRERYGWVAVDEYQDVDELQYRLLRLLCWPDGNLCAIGDPDQAIYGFRGADVGFFLRFEQDFPAAPTVRLTRNYRSSRAIVRGALQAIAAGSLVRGRVLEAARRDAAPPRIAVHQAADERDEAGFVARTIDRLLGGSSFLSLDSGRADGGEAALSFADIAVLYRTDAQAVPLVEALERAGMPVQRRSHLRLAEQPGVQAVLRALRGMAAGVSGGGPAGVAAVVRAAGAAALGEAGADEADEAAAGRVREALELLAPLAEGCGGDLERFLAEIALGAEVDTWDPRADRVSLLTLHAAKGLEFPVVFLVGCEDGLLPLHWGDPAAVDVGEERRLFFVGMTRARSHLILSHARARSRHGSSRAAVPSPFLGDIDEALLERPFGAAPQRRPAEARGDQLSLL